METHEGTTGRGMAAGGKLMCAGTFCRLVGVTLLDSRQGTWLVASEQVPEVQVMQQWSAEWRPEECISCSVKRFDRLALNICKIFEYHFIIL